MDKRLAHEEKTCTRCNLRKTCNQVVPGFGPSPCSIMIVGEAPGADEDRIGEPFVGASGKLLTKMLMSADIIREDVFITNIVRCRPPDNRTPEAEEIAACKSWLWEEIQLVRPLVVLAMGGTAARLLLRGNSSFRISKVVGIPQRADYLEWPSAIIVPMYHPSYLLQHKMNLVEDMVKVFIKAKRYVESHKEQGTV